MKRRGFTIVELVITITIMGILLTLAVVSLNATQANARDTERRADAEAIALNIENYYTNANATIPSSGGTYLGSIRVNSTDITQYLPDIDTKNIYAPETDTNGPMSFVPATNNNPTIAGVLPRPSKANDVYVYQPITATGALCTNPALVAIGDCRRFNIFFYQETSNTIEMITSKHQS